MQGPCTAILISKDEYKSISYLTISESVLTLIISLLMINYYGVLGAAYGVCISLCVIRGIMQPIIISRTMGIKILDYFKLMLFPIFTITLGFYLIDLLSDFLLASYHINYTLSFIITEASLYLILFTIIYIRIKNE
ncbi:polysaccharide biosynthesis C-terminal domain-containing protein [Pseudoalteromonas espejiana]